MEKKNAPPKNPGSKEIPEGNENCLHGLTFVLTGELDSIGREDATDLIKKCGGKVTTAPSSRTSFVIVGEDAGPKKLEKVKELKIATLNEDEFFDLIRERSQLVKSVEDSQSKEMVIEPVKETSETVLKIDQASRKMKDPISNGWQLWTEKYRPASLDEFIGNQTNLTKLADFLKGFDPQGNEKTGFRAALLSGPPGIGKTTAAHLVSSLEGFKVVEFNASDTRSKKNLHVYFFLINRKKYEN